MCSQRLRELAATTGEWRPQYGGGVLDAAIDTPLSARVSQVLVAYTMEVDGLFDLHTDDSGSLAPAPAL